MTHETATSPVHTAHRHVAQAHAHVGGAKPPTDRNLGLTPSWHIGALAATAAVALGLGVWSLTQVDPLRIGGAGLIGVLPPAYFVALGLILAGMRIKQRASRYAGVALLGVTLAKLFLHDLSDLDELYRIGAFVGVAVILIAASFIYQRFLAPEAT